MERSKWRVESGGRRRGMESGRCRGEAREERAERKVVVRGRGWRVGSGDWKVESREWRADSGECYEFPLEPYVGK